MHRLLRSILAASCIMALGLTLMVSLSALAMPAPTLAHESAAIAMTPATSSATIAKAAVPAFAPEAAKYVEAKATAINKAAAPSNSNRRSTLGSTITGDKLVIITGNPEDFVSNSAAVTMSANGYNDETAVADHVDYAKKMHLAANTKANMRSTARDGS